MSTDIQRLDPARRALAEAEALPEIAKLIDYGEAAKQAAKRAGLAEESQKAWAIFSLEAQRKAGELLRQAPKHEGGRPRKTGVRVTPVSSPPPLRDVLGTQTDDEAKNKSSRWQAVADVPQETFEEYVEDAEEPSRAGLLKHAAQGHTDERVTDWMASDDQLADREFMARFTKALTNSGAFMEFDPEKVGALASDLVMQTIEDFPIRVGRWVTRVRAARPRGGLRVVGGDK